MMPDKHSPQNPSLEQLFALKRAEKPPTEFWDGFQREFHVRQRAAAIEPKRWWFVLPRVLAGFSRYQMPVGAAAVLAVTFLSFREYQEPGFEVAFTASPAAMAAGARAVAPSSSLPVAATPELSSPAPVAVTEVKAEASAHPHATRTFSDPVSISPMVVWAGVAAGGTDSAAATISPSARSIAANLAAIESEQSVIDRLLPAPRIQLATASAISEPLHAVSLERPSRDRLFAYEGNAAEYAHLDGDENGLEIPRRIARRLSDEQLYESVRRVTAGGDRLTLKF